MHFYSSTGNVKRKSGEEKSILVTKILSYFQKMLYHMEKKKS